MNSWAERQNWPRASCRPSPEIEDLLELLFLPPARRNRKWRSDRERLLRASESEVGRKLHGLLYQELAGVAERERWRDGYLECWRRNHLLRRRLEDLIRAGNARGLRLLLLKGSALVPLYYSDVGTRWMVDNDVLVSPENVPTAMDILRTLGFRESQTTRWRLVSSPAANRVNYVHALSFRDEQGLEIDLHWKALKTWGDAAAERRFRERSRLLPSLGAWALAPSDQLLHILVHASGRTAVDPRWIIDSRRLLLTERKLQWDCFIDECRRRKLILPVREALAYLKGRFLAPVPDAVLAELFEERIAALDRLEHRLHATALGSQELGNLPLIAFRFRHASAGEIGAEHLPIGLRYLRYTAGVVSACWGIDGPSQFPRLVARKVASLLAMRSARAE